MMLIGVDPHKSTATATVVEPETNREVASIRIEATLKEYRRLLTWAHRWPDRRWAIENAEGLGRHLASWLLARGEQVVDVPTTATARVRQLSRGGGRKNDRIDKAAAACVAALQGDARPLEAEGTAHALGLLDERRANLSQARVRVVNQLHALFRALLAGGAPTGLSAAAAAALLRTVRPVGEAERVRKHIANDLVAEIRALDARLKTNEKAMTELVKESGSTLTRTVGIGDITAARLIGRTGRPNRFSTGALTPTTPVQRRSRWPAPTRPVTGCPGPGTVNSTPRCTPSRSPRSGRPAAAATSITKPRSPRAKPRGRPGGA
jgi:transposase